MEDTQTYKFDSFSEDDSCEEQLTKLDIPAISIDPLPTEKKNETKNIIKKQLDEENSHMIYILALVVLVGAGYLFFYQSDSSALTENSAEALTFDKKPYINWPDDVDCSGADDCTKKGNRALQMADDLLARRDVRTEFLYLSFENYQAAGRYFNKGDVKPAAYGAAKPKFNKVREELNMQFRKMRARYIDAEKRKMFRAMSRTLDEVDVYFPGKMSRESRWAKSKRESLIRAGTFPSLSEE